MPKVPNLFEKQLANVFDRYSGDVGDALIHLGAVGWLFSAAAQITMIAKNKDIDKKEKKFLIPQEVADGVINVGLYYTVCKGIKNLGNRLLENCVFITPKTNEFMNNFNNNATSLSEFVKGVSEKINNKKVLENGFTRGRLTNFYKGSIAYIEKLVENNFNHKYGKPLNDTFSKIKDIKTAENLKNEIETALKEFKSFKNGVGVIAAVGASVLACNLITPVARNLTANYYQKKLIERTKKRNPITKTATPYILPASKTFNVFKI